MWSSLARLANSPKPNKTREDTLTSFSKAWEALFSSISARPRVPLDRMSPIPRHLGQMLALLTSERASHPPQSLGLLLEHMLENGSLMTLVRLVTKEDESSDIQVEVLRWYGRIVVELDESLLAHSAVSKPLVKLLRVCVDAKPRLSLVDEEAVVDVMCTMCERIRNFPVLLAIFFRESSDAHQSKVQNRIDTSPALLTSVFASRDALASESSERPLSPTFSDSTHDSTLSTTNPSAASATSAGDHSNVRKKSEHEHDFLLFSYLLRFVHREGTIGDLARAGLLFLVEVATGSTHTYHYRVHRPPTSSPPSAFSTEAPGAEEATLSLAEYLLDSDFAEVLAAGLGALYGLLPGKLIVRPPGASSGSPSKNPSWEDPIPEAAAGGMILGGMGALEDDQDPEEVERRREAEDDRLRELGVGISGTSDFREGLDGWLKLVEFTQDVLRRSPDTVAAFNLDDNAEEDALRQQRLITSALSSSILSAIKSLFLQNVVYPSILECSDADGSAVAVLSYLDAMLSVVEEGTSLEGTLLSFLMGEDDALDLSRRNRANTSGAQTSTSSPKKVRKRKSNALVLIQNETRRGESHPSVYFTSLGRFSLKDLLMANIHSTSQATATAALKLFQTMLSRHDRWCMGLLDVVLDEGATSFPVALRQEGIAEPEGNLEFLDEDTDEEVDVFVYPTEPVSPATPRPRPPATPKTPGRGTPLLLGTPLPPTPFIKAHCDSIDTLFSLLASIDPSYRSSRAVGGGSQSLSTGFANYLQDAEASLAADLGFRRGIMAPIGAEHESIEVAPQARRRSTLFGAPPNLSAREFAETATGFRHKLTTTGSLLSLILDSLAHFFSHAPDHNLCLTAVLATLALCPFRSVEGWMLPPVREVDGIAKLAELLYRNHRREAESDDGDDRSIDGDIDELSRHDAFLSSSPTPIPPSQAPASKPKSISLLSILSDLATSVSHYRSTIPNFDTYLSERRQGLMFVENLADALEISEEGNGNAFVEAVKNLEASAPVHQLSTPAKPKGLGFGSFLSPRSTTPTDLFSTPRRPPLSRENSTSPSISPSGGGRNGPASPFAQHYRQTGSISVKPVVVNSPLAPIRTRTGDGLDEDEEDEDEEGGSLGPPDTPTKSLTPRGVSHTIKSSSPSSAVSDKSSSNDQVTDKHKPKRRGDVAPVSLSIILDNTIILEEFLQELAAILTIRRSLGIDAVRLV